MIEHMFLNDSLFDVLGQHFLELPDHTQSQIDDLPVVAQFQAVDVTEDRQKNADTVRRQFIEAIQLLSLSVALESQDRCLQQLFFIGLAIGPYFVETPHPPLRLRLRVAGQSIEPFRYGGYGPGELRTTFAAKAAPLAGDVPEFGQYHFSKCLESLVIFLERLAAARGDVTAFVGIERIAVNLSDNVIRVNLFLTEIAQDILLRELAPHEYRDTIEIVSFLVLELP